MEIKRFDAIEQIRLSDGGEACLLTLNMSDKTKLDLELTVDKLPLMIRALFACAQAAGERSPPKQALVNIAPSNAVPIPTEEFVTQSMPGGGLWVMLRAGSVDLSVAFPDPRSSKALGEALLKPE